MKYSTAFLAAAVMASSASAVTINFVNNCGFTVWAAVGKAPNGVPDASVAYGAAVSASGGTASYGVDDSEIGIRAWGRTGCDSTGSNCATGGCVGGLTCTDGGINSGVIAFEFGYADFGTAYGGIRTSWDLSLASLSLNLDTSLSSSDGQSVVCTAASCPPDQAYSYDKDYAADRNSPLGQTYTHTFCG